MTRLPSIKSSKLDRLLRKLGFIEVRQSGSHRFFRHPQTKRTTVVPMHNQDVGQGWLRKIISDIDLSIDEFVRMK